MVENESSGKVKSLSAKGCNFLLGRTYFTGNDSYQKFLVFAPIFNSLTLDSNKRVTNWISNGVSQEKIKPFDANLCPTMTNLANGQVSLKLNSSVLVQKNSSSLYSNFILNLNIVS